MRLLSPLLPRIFALLVVLAIPAGADTVTYTFGSPGQETTAETGAAYSPVVSGSLSGTPISDPAGAIAIEISSAATAPPSAPFLRVDPQGNSTTPELAITNNKYFQFTITPTTGTLLPQSLEFDAARGGAGTPRGYAVRSSADNFASTISSADLATVRPLFTHVTIPLTAPQFQGLSSLTFRVYSYSPAAGNSVDYDNIVFTAVPEPTSAALLLGTLLPVALRRRRE